MRTLQDTDAAISALALGEIEYGVSRLPQGRKRRELEAWFNELLTTYGDHVLEVSTTIARRWGQMRASCETAGVRLQVVDGLMAATAATLGLCLVTRNIGDFKATGIALYNPWAPLP
jgi:predicted nucleic acid-binding protein